MTDKDLYVVIAEMLRKQDQQAEILERIEGKLTDFMDVSVKQFGQQQKFNVSFLSAQENLSRTQNLMSDALIKMVDKMDDFNSRLDSKLP
ncbi:MAG: hypothetical protein INR69_03735 [Mucilaginibacter polytrichastri]|nr:hypothetical protein [Mucilaginibacter polytrichastri]